MNIIKYSKPAKTWREALPLGNGKTGLMIYGSLSKEKICFNDGTFWSGYPKDYNSNESLENLDKVRSLIFDGKNAEADALCEEKLTGFYSEAFMPLGEVNIEFKGLDKSKYSRSLNLSKAVHTVETMGAKSECFSSYPDGISVYRVTSAKPFCAVIRAKSKLKAKVQSENNSLFLLGNAPDYAAPNYLRTELYPVRYNEKKGMAFCLQTHIETNGKIIEHKSSIKVQNATELTLYFVTATGFNGFDKMPNTDTNSVKQKCKALMNSVNKDYTYLKSRHISDFAALYNNQSISFDCDREINTDELLKSVKCGKDEIALTELMYNYGKYMIISGSRKGSQPLNLQGVWNNSVRPPWSSNYTVNINTQMNYWGASRSGLSACIEPLIQMVYEVMQNGKKTAEVNYGCRGFACNHNVDLWRKTPPVKGDANYMFSPLCGAWLVNEIYSHYKNGELNEYKNKIKELVTESAIFLNDFLVLHNGEYVICPSVSPENVFAHNGKNCKLDYASAYDMGLVRQAFKNALEISDNTELLNDIKTKLPLLYPFKEGKNGICEWHKDYETPENGHRHFSPLYAFYPGNIIGYYGSKEQTERVRKLYRFRTENSTQYIGWSAAWAICLSARLREKETVSKVIRSMLSHSVFKNLFCVHPPFYFQIDGNLGFVAGVNEMLLTEENGTVELLPALPDNYTKSGRVQNMVVNGAKISFEWKDGVVVKASADKQLFVYNKNLSDNIVAENIVIKEL
ncbi:MAG: glycoside hydrolase family 95 protein [Clostridia bacterium]|nr:glycoside hydrolase family 95 protein [Clostridia bacterium]